MEIFIAENLRRLRTGKGLRQEELAKHIGISVQSVSKWERGEALPDTVLLPNIAEFYGVTVDELLGVGKIRREAEIQKFKAKFDTLGEKKEYFAQLKLAKKIYADYPGDITVMRCMMDALRRSGYFEESLKFTEKLLASDIDSSTRYEAIRNGAFCARYAPCRTALQARHNIDKSVRYADMLPGYFETRNQLSIGIHPSTGLATENIEALMLCLCANIRALQGDDVREKIHLWKIAAGLIEIVCDGDYGALTDALLRFYLFIAHDCAIIGDNISAYEYLHKSAEIAIRIDADPNGVCDAGLLRGRKYTCSGKARATLRCQMERWAGFAGIKDDQEFKAILESLGDHSEANETLMIGESFAYDVVNLATMECSVYSGSEEPGDIAPTAPEDCVPALKKLYTYLPNCHEGAYDEGFIRKLDTVENDIFALRENGEVMALGVVNKSGEVWEIALLSGRTSDDRENEFELARRMLAFCTKYISDNGRTARLRISVLNDIFTSAGDIGYERVG
ncbi:MAG: helix-turn-helix transcriptional regulator [Oscillospiraceae bacterium]|nr:helix-turn-helix transcriptional regulator [Oscillospiraceae bacterium]